ncbi:MAG: TorF family putative porin [bacterium]
MKKLLWISILAILCLNVTTQATSPPTIGADLAIKSKYIWRGIPFNQEAVFWPDFWLYWNGFTFTAFGSMELTDIFGNQNKFTEVDYYFDYTRSFGIVSANLGYAHYTYPNTEFKTTGEIYGKANVDLVFLKTALMVYYDVMEAQGIYITPQISKSFPMPLVQPTLTLSLGYADKKHNGYWIGVEKAGFTDFTSTLNLSYAPPAPLGNYLSISGDLNYASILQSDLADVFGDDKENFWWGIGLHLTYTPGGGE